MEQLSSHDSPAATASDDVRTAVAASSSGEVPTVSEGGGAQQADVVTPGQAAENPAAPPQQEQPAAAQQPQVAVDEHPGMIRVPDEYRDVLGGELHVVVYFLQVMRKLISSVITRVK